MVLEAAQQGHDAFSLHKHLKYSVIVAEEGEQRRAADCDGVNARVEEANDEGDTQLAVKQGIGQLLVGSGCPQGQGRVRLNDLDTVPVLAAHTHVTEKVGVRLCHQHHNELHCHWV